MTWIPLYGTVFSDPKVTKAADQLAGGDVYRLVGHLAALWVWVIDNCEDGDLSHLRPQAIANAAGWTGGARRFVKVLVAVGLFDEGPKVHKADKYFRATCGPSRTRSGAQGKCPTPRETGQRDDPVRWNAQRKSSGSPGRTDDRRQ